MPSLSQAQKPVFALGAEVHVLIFVTADISAQGKLQNDVSPLIDEAGLRTTHGKNSGTITTANLREARTQTESGQAKGKIAPEGFPA